ncbi:MAG: xylose isomerase, partial [Clostridia bacterium]|nr:xylose isomerase [Clostridia bacterium]
FALGLIKAAELIEDGRIDDFIKDKYASFDEGIGERIVRGEATLEELSDYACGKRVTVNPDSGRQEYLQTILNQILF